MDNNVVFADVILPLAVKGYFTYNVPPAFVSLIKPGMRVVVQFGSKKLYTGIVFLVHNNKPDSYLTKPIIELPDDYAVVNKYQLRLWEWVADYYMCAVGDVYKAALPNGLRLESESRLLPVTMFDNYDSLNTTENLLLSILQKNMSMPISDLLKLKGFDKPMNVIKNLINKGAVIVDEEVQQKVKPKTLRYIKLAQHINNTDYLNQVLSLLQKAPKQQKFFEFFLHSLSGNYFSDTGIEKKILIEQSGVGTSIIKGLVDKKILVEYDVEVSRLNIADVETTPKKQLNQHQQTALNQINHKFKTTDVVLLHGVTSSGKTEIFIHLIEQAVNSGRQVLYLLPEIALTSQIIKRLQNVFGNKVGVYHSKFSDAERVETYTNLLNNTQGTYQIILGVRSSIFLPFSRLGLIIVDEEHENTYKQFDPAPRYNARDLAVVLAMLHKAKVLLGTATPGIETYYNARTNRYGLVELNQRYQNINLPQIEVADVRWASKRKQMQSHFTPALISQIEQALANNEQVILFQNRRGFSPYLECKSCGQVPKCKYCDVSLTYHKGINKLICHYCGYSVQASNTCNYCGSTDVETKGFGTEKIEDEISLIFPNARVGRLDLDTARGKYSHEVIITDFQEHRIDILIGTQMVSKGLDFDHVSVVGILNADSMLNYPDFRAHERSYQLMAQVSGRAGRKNKQGKVIVQTYDAKNSIIKQVIDNDYFAMYTTQLNERNAFMYPPFSRLIKVTIKHRDKQVLDSGASLIAKNIRQIAGNRLLGPTWPVINRIQNFYIKQILIKLEKGKNLAQVKRQIIETTEQVTTLANFKSLVVVFDVDPA